MLNRDTRLTELLNNKERRLYLDGGMGSEIISRGFASEHAEIFNIENGSLIEDIHLGYINSGANVIYTNTFSCNRYKADTSKYSLKEIIISAIKNAKAAIKKSGKNIAVLYDCGPSGLLLAPYGKANFSEVYDSFAEQAKVVAECDVDGVAIETFTDLQELRAAYLAFSENTNLPIICSMSFEKHGKTFSGTKVESFALTAQGLGAVAIGINCGTGPEEMYGNMKVLSAYAHVPIFAKANAGLPIFKNGEVSYDLDSRAFAEKMKDIAGLGVGILGGCCGTSSEYICETVKHCKDVPVKIFNNYVDAVCSYSKLAFFGTETLTIGERINPTNKPLLKEAIKENNYQYILSMCVAQISQGADVLDINVGMAGADETEKLPAVIENIQGVADLPISIDTSKKLALEKALRITDGIAMINSVTGDDESMAAVFPLAKKYGSYVIALCLDKNGIPTNVDGRLAVAEKIIKAAQAYGIDKCKLIFDPLTMAVGVDINNAKITLETIISLKSKLNVKTVLGLSNVSFGLPNRERINSTFFAMVKAVGVSSAIVNPSIKPEKDVLAENMLKGKDKGCEKYIAENSGFLPIAEPMKRYSITECILYGLSEEGLNEVKLKATANNYSDIIENEVILGLNKLGEAFERGMACLPQLMAGSDAAKVILDYIKGKYMISGCADSKATVILATVKGDVHDIGKNIVKAVISNYGFKVVDLGKDVACEEILREAEGIKPDVVALSALMTTTLDNMTDTVKRLRKEYPDIKIFVGGAIVSKDYADELGVFYSKDAQECAKLLNFLFK